MTEDSKTKKTGDRHIITTVIIIAVICLVIATPILSYFTWSFTINTKINDEVEHTYMTEAILPRDMIANIQADIEEIENPDYQAIKEGLMKVRQIDSEILDAYIYKLDSGRLRYIANSEEVTSEDYAYPGMMLKEEDNELYRPFVEKKVTVYQQKEKVIRSILVPILDKNDDVLAVLGVDYSKKAFVGFAFVNTLALILLITLMIIILLLMNQSRKKKMEYEQKDDMNKIMINEMKQGLALHEIIVDENNKPVDYRFISVNQSFLKITGLTNEEIIGKTVLEIFPETESYWITEYGKVAMDGVSCRLENYSKELDKYFEVYAYCPKHRQFATVINDITDCKNTEKKLHEEKLLLETTLSSVGDGVITTDKKGAVLLLNRVAEIMTGWTQKEASGHPLEEVFNTMSELTGKTCDEDIKDVYSRWNTFEFKENYILTAKNGVEMPIEGVIAPIKDNYGNYSGTVLVFRDFSERKKKLIEIEYLSFRDKLTGLYNRRFFDEEFKRIDTKRNYPLTVVMADVNGLKLINDAFGHMNGDKLLVKFADAVKKESRADDIVARIGGDEFVLLLPKTDVDETIRIIERLKNNIKKENVCDIEISAAFGYGTKYDETLNMDNVLKRAEAIMYKNKLNESSSLKKAAIDIILETFHQKYPREKEHAYNAMNYCSQFARALQFNAKEIREMELLGLMHNIGKINIGEAILNRDQDLDEEESFEIRRHADIGYQILRSVIEFSELSEYVLEHHEKWDGSGYPRGLQREDISIQARILAIAEVYDRMVNTSYKKPLSREEAINQLLVNKGKQFDPHLVDIFIDKVI
ncbi:MAG: diguanylate cyclase [Clostridia bacterium]|nr:diguanylate cyclase [Clostridia bacterium]